MYDFDLDKLYGCTLGEYCEHHGITIDELINKTRKDIELLQEKYEEIARNKDKYTSDSYEIYLAQARQILIDKKRRHLERLLEWKKKH